MLKFPIVRKDTKRVVFKGFLIKLKKNMKILSINKKRNYDMNPHRAAISLLI